MVISKRNIIRIVSFFVAILLVVVCYVCVFSKEINDFKLQTENVYNMNLSELDGSLNNISVALQKAVYASSATQLCTLAAELCTEATVAKNALAQLPYSNQSFSNVNKFLSQIGDYTLYLSKKVIHGEKIKENEREQLHNMSLTAQKIAHSVDNVKTQFETNGKWSENLNQSLDSTVDNSISSDLNELEELLVDFPSLVYDGPFSDHMLNGEIKMIENKETITVDNARKIAAEVFNIKSENLGNYTETTGKIECYNFDASEMSISITKQGGFVVYMRKYREIGEHKISYEEAVKTAVDYLNLNSDERFVSTYYFADEGVCTVNLAYKEGATVCYPDLIKVGVALDTGEIVLVDAASYLANHYMRTISTPKFSVSDAENKLSNALKSQAVKRVIIPTNGNEEKHCYEFLCKGINDEDLLVYINVDNLEEEEILVLLSTDGGTLTK